MNRPARAALLDCADVHAPAAPPGTGAVPAVTRLTRRLAGVPGRRRKHLAAGDGAGGGGRRRSVTGRWGVAAAGLVAAASGVAGVAGAAPAGAQVSDPGPVPDPAAAPAPPDMTARKVLVISVPGLTWSEVEDSDLPNIEALLEQSALADMAPRGVSARSTPGDAYLTISAGSRSVGMPEIDGQQLGLLEQSAGSAAGEIFERRTGTRPDGDVVSLVWPTLVRANAAQPYDAELGLLADTLEADGLGAVAIGNADGTDSIGSSYERQVGLAVATSDGVVPGGDLGKDLLQDDSHSPFGTRLDAEVVVDRFRDAWRAPDGHDGGLVLVEASDLARTMRYRSNVDASRYREMRTEALAETDALVGRLVREVDPARDAVLLVAPYNLPGDRDLTVAAMRAPDQPAGYMRSASTQRSGFVTLVDVAPSILDLLDVERPLGMEGRSFEPVASGDSLGARVDRLVALNAASRFRERLLFPTTLAVVVGLALVCAATMVLLARGGSGRARRLVAMGALADLAALPMSYVARGFPLEDLGAGFYWALVVLGAVAIAVAATAVASRLGRPRLALVLVLSLVLVVLAGDVMTGSRLSLSAAFGYSPTGNSRLYGISNYSFGQVAAASCLLAGLMAALPGRRGRLGAIGLLVAVLVVVGVPIWGSDVGGIIAFTPTILLFASLVWRNRVRLRHLVIGGVVTVGAVTAFGLLDLARPPEQRAHLGRLFERVGDEGIEPLLSIMERKALANLRVTTTSFWVAAIPIAVAFIVFLARYPGRPLDRLRERIPTLQAGLLAAAVAAVLGSAANDSGAIVGGVALMVVAASLVHLVVDAGLVPSPPVPPSAAEAAAVAASEAALPIQAPEAASADPVPAAEPVPAGEPVPAAEAAPSAEAAPTGDSAPAAEVPSAESAPGDRDGEPAQAGAGDAGEGGPTGTGNGDESVRAGERA
jgi:hypothetical protein